MSGDRRSRIRELFEACLSHPSAEAQTAFLSRECVGDEEVLLAVRNLLDASVKGASFLEKPLDRLLTPQFDSGDATTGALPVLPEENTRIGPYKIRELIGEGGFGLVYVAEQESPLRRKVALKLIKPGMDSRQIMNRFEAERQALSLMDHPHIARVLDAGTTDNGRPYFVMELVHGVHLNRFCDQQKLPVTDRLRLFIDVCHAVQHAHQKGIIHRDLKPSNILVTMRDDRPIAKVIDFGVAKAINQRLTEETVYTAFGQMIGTPMYMSPEQAQMNELDVDTRSDVYSLGVLLYELLTGTPPFDPETVKRVAFDELRRLIREAEPQRPSLRVQTLQLAVASTVADRRRIDRRHLSKHLRGELDWIVMKAIEKDRNRRYQSAGELAADLQRYLHGEAVQACPPSLGYRLSKFVWRHKGLLTTSALIFLAMLVGLIAASLQTLRASRAEQRALVDRDHALEAEERMQRLLYAADIRRAYDAWRDHDVSRAHEALMSYLPANGQPDLRGFEWYYLACQMETLQRDLLHGDSPVYFVMRTPQGLIAAAGADGRIQFVDEQAGTLQRSVHSEQGELNGLAISPDGQWIASAGDDGTITLRNLNTLEQIWRVKAHQEQAFQVAFLQDGKAIVSCGAEPDAKVWNTENGTLLAVLPTEDAELDSLAVSATGQIALAAKWGGVWIFDRDLKTIHRRWEYRGRCLVDFSASGRMFAMAHGVGAIAVYDTDDLDHVVRQWKVPGDVRSLAFSPDERLLAVGDAVGAVHLISVSIANDSDFADLTPLGDTAVPYRSWHAHQGRLHGLAFTADGHSLVTAGGDGRVVSWSLAARSGISLDIEPANDVAFDRHGNLWSAGERSVRIVAGGLKRSDSVEALAPWKSLAVARNADLWCATQETDPEIFGLAADRHGTQIRWRAPAGHVCRKCALSPDGRRLMVEVVLPHLEQSELAGPRYLELVDLVQQQSLARISCGEVYDLRFSPDGRFVVYTRSNRLLLVSAESGQLVREFIGHQTTIRGVAFDPQGAYLASVGGDRQLKLWNVESGQEIWSEFAHRFYARDVAFSEDGHTLATVGDDGIVRLWRWRDRRLAAEIPFREGAIHEVEFSPDSRQLAIRFASRQVKLLSAQPRGFFPATRPD